MSEIDTTIPLTDSERLRADAALTALAPFLAAALAEAKREGMREAAGIAERVALEEGRAECCGHGVVGGYGSPPECCGDPDYVVPGARIAAAILAAIPELAP